MNHDRARAFLDKADAVIRDHENTMAIAVQQELAQILRARVELAVRKATTQPQIPFSRSLRLCQTFPMTRLSKRLPRALKALCCFLNANTKRLSPTWMKTPTIRCL